MNDKHNKAISSNDKADDKLETKKPTSKPFKWSILFIIIALILAVSGLAGAAYMWFQFEQYKQQSSTQISNVLNSVEMKLSSKLEANDVSKQILPLLSPLNAQIKAIEKNSQAAALARNTLTESTQKLFELYGRDKNGWQLAEVEYLLRIAQHRLVIENDFQGAEKTLKAADEKISEIADPGLLPVRVAISDERVLLQSRRRADLVGIVLSLSRIIKQIPLLDLSANKPLVKSAESAASPSQSNVDSNASWQQQVVQFVKGLVKVAPLQKSLSVPSVNLIDAINTLEEKLKLAKWAVLERDQRQYHQLMQQSQQLFKQYFDENNNYHHEVNVELERLLNLEIRPELPDISGSLLLLKATMLKKEHAVIKEISQQQQPKPDVLTLDLLKQELSKQEPKEALVEAISERKVTAEVTKKEKGESNE